MRNHMYINNFYAAFSAVRTYRKRFFHPRFFRPTGVAMSSPECATSLKQTSRTLPHDKRSLGWNHPAFGRRINPATMFAYEAKCAARFSYQRGDDDISLFLAGVQ